MLNLDKYNTIQPKSKTWPKCLFFGIYSGFGGITCSEYLRDHLHHFIINDSNFPSDPSEAIKRGFVAADNYFLNQVALNKNLFLKDKSGACALVLLIVGKVISLILR